MNKVIYGSNELKESQNITIINRAEIEITGVSKIESLNEYEFYVITILGNMIIRGLNLEMKQLDTSSGILQISGKIMSIEYTDEIKKKEKSFFGKIFKWSKMKYLLLLI